MPRETDLRAQIAREPVRSVFRDLPLASLLTAAAAATTNDVAARRIWDGETISLAIFGIAPAPERAAA